MARVLVLLSTYNGERYLEEQLTTILKQEQTDVFLFVRDDGSTDRTQTILDQWQHRYPQQIEWIQGQKNLGPEKSYLELIQLVKDKPADYYAFADQDDVWRLDKLAIAQRQLTLSQNKPALFMSTYNVVDQDLNLLFKRDMHFSWPFTLESTLVYRCPSGCTMVFNRALFNILVASRPEYIRMHDFWTLLTAEAVGAQLLTSEEPLLEYRQHGDNAVGFNKGETGKKIKRLFKSMIFNKNERQRQGIAVLENYRQYCRPEQLASLTKLAQYRHHLKNRFLLAFDDQFKTQNHQKNFLFKLSVLLGAF